jgi:bifunctional non-homologous end joining protein LigD
MPIEWRELAQDVRAAHFDFRNVPQRLKARKGDPWAQYDEARQTLRASMLRALEQPSSARSRAPSKPRR